MNLKEKILLKIRANNEENQALTGLLALLPDIGVHVEKAEVSMYGAFIDIDRPSRGDVVRLLSALKIGKWNKESAPGQTLIYVTDQPVVGRWKVRLWSAEPPGSCKIVEEEVLVPAVNIPEHVEKRKRLVCAEPAAEEPA